MAPLVASAALIATVDCGDPIGEDVAAVADAAPDSGDLVDSATRDGAIVDGDAGAAFSIECVDGAAFCDDFGDAALTEHWGPAPEINGTSATFDLAAEAESAPWSLRLSTGADDAAARRTFWLRHAFPSARRVTCGVSVKVKASSDDSDLVALELENGHQIWIDSRHDGGTRANTSGGSSIDIDETLDPGRWTRIEIETDHASAIVRYDGQQVFKAQNPVDAGETITLRLGPDNYEVEGSEVLYDDVVCIAE